MRLNQVENVRQVDLAECTKISFAYIHQVDFTTSWTFFQLVEVTKMSATILFLLRLKWTKKKFCHQIFYLLLFAKSTSKKRSTPMGSTKGYLSVYCSTLKMTNDITHQATHAFPKNARSECWVCACIFNHCMALLSKFIKIQAS